MTEMPSPEELARAHGLPLVRALIDLDLGDPSPQVMAGNPMDLSGVEMVPIRSTGIQGAVVTVMAHQGDEERVAALLRIRAEVGEWVLHYAEHYLKEGVTDFAMQAYTDREMQNLEQLIERDPDRRPGDRAGEDEP